MAAIEGGRPHTAAPRRIGIGRRLVVAGQLMMGLRTHDFRAAGTFVKMKFGKPMSLSVLPSFAGWVLKQMFVDIPEAVAEVRFADKLDNTPLWLTIPNPLANHPWAQDADARLPDEVDTLVIGAGMTGGALAYHWGRHAPAERHLAVLEMDDPASGASGRNGGSLVMGRFFHMVRKLLEDYWERTDQHGGAGYRTALATRFAEAYCAAAYRNAEMIVDTIRSEGIDCDHTRNGWIQLRDGSQQQDLDESVRLAEQYGFTDWARIRPAEIERLSGLVSATDSGISQRAGQYHPAKWVWGLFRVALTRPNVRLYTRTKVLRVVDAGEAYEVHTSRGTIRARHVVSATEAYTAALHPQFARALEPFQTQLCAVQASPPRLKPGITVSSPTWFGERRGDTVILGSDETRIPDRAAGQNKPSRWITKFVLGEVQRYAGRFPMRVVNEWSGSVGFTVDQFPMVGVWDGKRQYVVGGMCGSGTGVSFNASRCVVNRILGRTGEQDDYPAEFFAPSRLLSPATHPWPKA